MRFRHHEPMANQVSVQLFAGLGGSELILMGAIVLLLAGASVITGFARTRHDEADGAGARAYLDALLGPSRP